MEGPENNPRNNLPINRKVIEAVQIAGDAAIEGITARFMGEVRSKSLPSAAQQNLRDRGPEIEEVMRRALKRATSIAKKDRPKRWTQPITQDDKLTTFGDLRKRLSASADYVRDEVAHREGMHATTAEAAGLVYDEALLQLEITISRLQDPIGEAARRIRTVPPTGGKGA